MSLYPSPFSLPFSCSLRQLSLKPPGFPAEILPRVTDDHGGKCQTGSQGPQTLQYCDLALPPAQSLAICKVGRQPPSQLLLRVVPGSYEMMCEAVICELERAGHCLVILLKLCCLLWTTLKCWKDSIKNGSSIQLISNSFNKYLLSIMCLTLVSNDQDKHGFFLSWNVNSRGGRD